MVIAFQRNDNWMLIASALQLTLPPSLKFQVLVDGVSALIVFRNLYESVLLVGLQDAQFGE